LRRVASVGLWVVAASPLTTQYQNQTTPMARIHRIIEDSGFRSVCLKIQEKGLKSLIVWRFFRNLIGLPASYSKF
jgi:hypothetical protein